MMDKLYFDDKASYANAMAEIKKAEWEGLRDNAYPFASHDFLLALEKSDSVALHKGWMPKHILLHDGANRLVGAAPCYVKGHSFGEYVFDYEWANAWQQAGGEYYPKLLMAIPFSPVTGPRLLVKGPEAQKKARRALLLQKMKEFCDSHNLSSSHLLFPDGPAIEEARNQGLLLRTSHQFHWQNNNYGCFEDFLTALSSRKRKTIRRERKSIKEAGLVFACLSGRDLLEEAIWDGFYQCYISTYDRKWGSPYLTRDFFSQIAQSLHNNILLIIVKDSSDGRLIASALNFYDEQAIYGRHWGCLVDIPFLHFEACYYRAIDYAIEQNLQRVEAGTQGPHKILRGYQPVPTHSAHYIPNRQFREALENHLKHENHGEKLRLAHYAKALPFREK